ncbi:hypothetical protein [Cochleicola gelatinilyticus]|uniref:Uncharacterized protein n=1 Tax=Cochleicola gelatinilyticus TaxID=1763537 RepID=A0A167H1L6_9FLAO|nr:hypothetical protein [Cochleicola gelatinilyticus]OAB78117.1 hypothetical protein ULVI_11590 [Cochleicola gelatinilyticus]
MKNLLLTAALLGSFGVFAQNVNVTEEVTTIKVANANNNGIEISTTEQTKTVTQDIALKNADSNQTNFSKSLQPKEINTEFEYDLAGTVYVFERDGNGFKMITVDKDESRKEYAKIKATNQLGYFYILTEGQPNAFGYYDEDANFVVESYNPTTDKIEVITYSLRSGNEIKNKTKEVDMKNKEMMKSKM